jgi:uncharacterized linocin/CFP29 family protein
MLGREAIEWGSDVWSRIDQSVHDEVTRSGVAARLIPVRGGVGDGATVPAERIDRDTMTIDERSVLPMLELSVDFALTQQQVADEPRLGTAATLAVRGASLLAQAEDFLVFRGRDALGAPLLDQVSTRGDAGDGLVGAAGEQALMTSADETGERIAVAVAMAYAELQERGHAGPFALALHSGLYAQALAPLPRSLVAAADRIAPLVPGGFVGTGTLPPNTGVLFSTGGNALDLVVGQDPITAFSQTDADGLYRFRVFERFVLRVKDPTAVVTLVFERAE